MGGLLKAAAVGAGVVLLAAMAFLLVGKGSALAWLAFGGLLVAGVADSARRAYPAALAKAQAEQQQKQG